jgi:Integrase zinc binding domain
LEDWRSRWTENNIFQREELHTKGLGTLMRYCEDVSWSQDSRNPGELETYNEIRQNYGWPGLQMFVKNYVQGWGICQQFKINRSPSNPAYIAIEGVNNTRPFAKCSMDLITDLLPVEGYNPILVLLWLELGFLLTYGIK